MIPPDFFFDNRHLGNYLEGSIVRYGDMPVWVMGTTMLRKKAKIHACHTWDTAQVLHDNLEDFDLSPVPLGMCNYTVGNRSTVSYLSRMPARKWKVGLYSANLGITSYEWEMDRVSTLGTSGFRDTVLGEYPSYKRALQFMRDTPGLYDGIAFCRHFAFQLTGEREDNAIPVRNHDFKVIGKGSDEGVQLDKKYHYLVQRFEQAGVPCVF